MFFHWSGLLRLQMLHTALVCNSNFVTNTVHQQLIFASTALEKKLPFFAPSSLLESYSNSCFFVGTLARNAIAKNFCTVKNYRKKVFFWGNFGPSNSINLHNFLYRSGILSVQASFHEAYGFLMPRYQRPPVICTSLHFVMLCPILHLHFSCIFLLGILRKVSFVGV